jgi:hypothetical protein
MCTPPVQDGSLPRRGFETARHRVSTATFEGASMLGNLIDSVADRLAATV